MLFVLGINSGLRISDLLALRLSDVVDAKGKVKETVSIRERKTDKVKMFRLNGIATKDIAPYVAALDKPLNLDAPLFPSRKGKGAISRVQAWEILNEAAHAVGLEEIGTHTLRKTFGYHARKRGVGIELLQVIFNHSSPAVTKRYLGITQDEIDEVYMTLNL